MYFDYIKKWAFYTPDKLFLREYNRSVEWSFIQFDKKVDALSDFFVNGLKLKKGDRVAVYSKNRAEFVILFCACIRTGTILVPLNFRLTPRELQTLAADVEPSLFIYERDFTAQAELILSSVKVPFKLSMDEIAPFLLEERSAENFKANVISEVDPVMILYTAGTTGTSKGVVINHRMLYWNAINTWMHLDINSQDHTQGYAPFFHTGGWNVLFTPFLIHGASHTLLQNFDAELILRLMEKERSTILFGVPTMLQMMSDLKYFKTADLSSVRYAIVGGAAMPIPLINIWHQKGIAIRQGFGLTEVGPNCFSLHQRDAVRKKGSIGFPNFYIETKIVREDGTVCNVNETGELWMKSPVVTPGYWRKEKETRECITDGFFHTGDLVQRDPEGYFFVVDRKKNMFISGGENVFPAEIESYLFTNKAIKEVAVIGVPDEKWGEAGKAFIVLKDGENLGEQDILDFCKGNLAKYKIPKYIVFIDAIPKTDAGKINKIELQKFHQLHLTNK